MLLDFILEHMIKADKRFGKRNNAALDCNLSTFVDLLDRLINRDVK